MIKIHTYIHTYTNNIFTHVLNEGTEVRPLRRPRSITTTAPPPLSRALVDRSDSVTISKPPAETTAATPPHSTTAARALDARARPSLPPSKAFADSCGVADLRLTFQELRGLLDALASRPDALEVARSQEREGRRLRTSGRGRLPPLTTRESHAPGAVLEVLGDDAERAAAYPGVMLDLSKLITVLTHCQALSILA